MQYAWDLKQFDTVASRTDKQGMQYDIRQCRENKNENVLLKNVSLLRRLASIKWGHKRKNSTVSSVKMIQ